MDVELYQTMNPVTSFVTQPKLQPGCVIRRENWSVLQKEGVVTSDDMRRCKQRMNTFAYIRLHSGPAHRALRVSNGSHRQPVPGSQWGWQQRPQRRNRPFLTGSPGRAMGLSALANRGNTSRLKASAAREQ